MEAHAGMSSLLRDPISNGSMRMDTVHFESAMMADKDSGVIVVDLSHLMQHQAWTALLFQFVDVHARILYFVSFAPVSDSTPWLGQLIPIRSPSGR